MTLLCVFKKFKSKIFQECTDFLGAGVGSMRYAPRDPQTRFSVSVFFSLDSKTHHGSKVDVKKRTEQRVDSTGGAV